jgi:hypothetical protein
VLAFLQEKDCAVHNSANRGDIEDPHLHMVLALPAKAARVFAARR